jgi:histidinol-phosphatase (PHP family)
LYDNHLHTRFSADSFAEPSDVISRAKEIGLTGVVFTDHWDVGYESLNAENIVPAEYAKGELRDYRTAGGDFGVLNGIELGPMPHVLDRVRRAMSGVRFDFVLLSAHYVDDVPQSHIDTFFRKYPKAEAYSRYLSTLKNLVELYGDYDALGHFDYVSRYAPYPDPLMRYRECADDFDALFSVLIRQNKALEINTATYRKLGARFPFDREILRRYRELGGELICLGSDAHRARDTGTEFFVFRDILLDCGFSSVVHYEDRAPVFEKL